MRTWPRTAPQFTDQRQLTSASVSPRRHPPAGKSQGRPERPPPQSRSLRPAHARPPPSAPVSDGPPALPDTVTVHSAVKQNCPDQQRKRLLVYGLVTCNTQRMVFVSVSGFKGASATGLR